MKCCMLKCLTAVDIFRACPLILECTSSTIIFKVDMYLQFYTVTVFDLPRNGNFVNTQPSCRVINLCQMDLDLNLN